MIPYLEHPSIHLGPFTIHAFGISLALAVLLGLELWRRRTRRHGLDPAVSDGMAGYALVLGFVGAHLFSVLFYFPEEVAANPLLLFKLWEDISSFGGMVGGALGMWLFIKLKGPSLAARARWRYLDAAAFAFTFAHDHPGTVTTFPLNFR